MKYVSDVESFASVLKMDAATSDKMSRSGRQVKTPSKFKDMEVADASGRRNIAVPDVVPVISAKKHQVLQTGAGKKRGRPPRVGREEMHPTASQELPSEDMDVDGFVPDGQGPSDESSATNGESATKPSLSRSDSSHDGTRPVIHHIIDAKRKELGVEAAAVAPSPSPSPPKKPRIAAVLASEDRPKRNRKKRPSPEEDTLAPKRRRGTKLTDLSADVDLPEGLLDAMRKKKQVTAYLAYCRAERPAVLRDMPKGNFTEYSKALGSRWMSLLPGEKDRWKRIANKITSILAAESDTGAEPTQARKQKDKLVRESEARMKEPAGSSTFDLVTNFRILGEQLQNISLHIDQDSGTEPAGFVDVLMDSAFVLVTSALGLITQIPVLQEAVEKELLDELAESAALVLPLLQNNLQDNKTVPVSEAKKNSVVGIP